jgi:hypothetical protein
MKNKGIKTVTFINMKVLFYDYCDEIIEYQDIEFGDYTNINDIDGFCTRILYKKYYY